MFNLSKEQRRFQFSLINRCPLCGKFPIVPRYFKGDGTPISIIKQNFFFIDRSAIAECPRCYQKWRVFASQEPTKYQPQYLVQIIESDRSEEQIGKEERLIDNLKSTIELERRFTISKEWYKLYAIEIEKLQANEKAVSAGLNIYLSDL